MKNFLLLLILFITQVVNAQTVLKPTTLIIGKGTDVDMSYVVDRAGTSDPFLRWNATSGKWCFSNDAVTCGEMVDKTYVDAQVAGATIADADATTKGKIQLAGDLSGTAAAPTVPALSLKAPLASPALTGVPTAPTATPLTNTTQIATTAYVDSAVSSSTIPDATTSVKGKVQLAGDLAGTAAAPTVPGLALKAPIASPTFTGTPAAPTATAGTNTTQLATTAFVTNAVTSSTAPDATTSTKGIVQLAGDLAGTATSPTVPGLALKAPLASPALTGNPTAPTATVGDNDTSVATTAFVSTAVTNATDPTKISGPASSQDNGLVRFDGTTGKLAQDSVITVSDTGTVASTSGNNLTLSTANTADSVQVVRNIRHQGLVADNLSNDTATGTNQTLSAPTTKVVRLTGALLTSIDGIPAGLVGQELVVVNQTSSNVIFNNETGATAANRIVTGTNASIKVRNNGAIRLVYDTITARWHVTSGVSGTAGIGSPDIAYLQDFEGSVLTDFTTTGTGTIITLGSPLHGDTSIKLTHQSSSGVNTFKQSFGISPKFAGVNLTMKFDCTSTASYGNLTLTVRDETNSTDLVPSEVISCPDPNSTTFSTSDSYILTFDVPKTTTTLSYKFSGAFEGVDSFAKPRADFIDDIEVKLTKTSLLSTSVTVPKAVENSFGAKVSSTAAVTDKVNSMFSSCSVASSVYTCGFSGLTSAPNCSTGIGSLGTQVQITTLSASQLIYTTYNSSGAITPVNVTWNCEKTGADYVDPTTSTTSKTIPLTQSGITQDADSQLFIENFSFSTASTNTQILTLSSPVVLTNVGNAITYIKDGLLGDSFKANIDGTYTFSVVLDSSSTTGGYGLSKNSTQLTTLYASIADANKICQSTFGELQTATCTVKLAKDDVVRLHNQTLGTTEAAARMSLTVSYQGSLRQVNVNKNSKIKIPTSEIRFEGSTSRGSTDTGVVKYDATTVLRGDAFTINPNGLDTTFGTHVKVNKDGFLCADMSIYNSAGTGEVVLTKNATNRTSSLSLTGSELFSGMSYAGTATGALLNSGNCGFVKNGDIIRPHSLLGPSANAGNIFTLTFQEQEVQVSVSNTLPVFTDTDSMYRATGSNGYGSTSTKIRRFLSVLENSGSDISCVDSATLGLACTANSDGVYSISYTDQLTPAAGYIGVSKNTSSQTTSVFALPASEVLCTAYVPTATSQQNCSWTGKLLKGDTVRPHTDGTASSGTQPVVFTVAKIGKPNVTTDVTAFANVPIMETDYISSISSGNGYGSSWTNTPRFSSVVQSGNGTVLQYIDSATNGASFKALQKCSVNISYGGPFGGVASTMKIKKGQTTATDGTVLGYSDGNTSIAINVSGSFRLEAGEVITFFHSGSLTRTNETLGIVATAAPSSVVGSTDTFSTDSNSLQFKSSDVASTDPVGTYSTYSWTASSNTKAACGTAPTQTAPSMGTDGLFITGRAYNVTGSCNTPSVFKIQVGKGLKGRTVNAYISSGKTTPFDWVRDYSDGAQAYGTNVYYDEKTGILTLDAGLAFSSAVTTRNVGYDINANVNVLSGYFVINMSKAPNLAGLAVSVSSITTPNLTKVKECYASYGGAAATLAVPTECSTGTCVEVEDSCNVFSAPTFATTGNYSNLIIANGTFANSTPITCTCKGFTTTTGIVRGCDVAFKTGGNTWITNSSGGYTGDVWAYSATGTASNGYFRVSCKAQAP